MANLRLARSSPNYQPPRPFRCKDEAYMIRRFVFQWFTCQGYKPSGRSWAKQLGISNAWLVKLCHEFAADPSEMLQAQIAEGDPKFADLERAREGSHEMRQRGELRPTRYRQWKRLRREERAYVKNRRLKAEAEIPFGRQWKRRMRANRNMPKSQRAQPTGYAVC